MKHIALSTKPRPKILLLAVVALILLLNVTSCVRYSNYVYLQEKKEADTTYYTVDYKAYKLQTEDVLFITISSTNEHISAAFDEQSANGYNSQTQNSASAYYNGYKIDPQGNVEVPIVGLINLNGKTLLEAEEHVKAVTREKFPDAIVKVRLINNQVTFFGETAGQGRISFFADKLNIIEAFATIGGIGELGDRRHVLVMRKTPEGYKSFYVDMTQRRIIESEHFFLYPNDIVYVRPLPIKPFRYSLADYSMFMGIASSILATTLLIMNLVK